MKIAISVPDSICEAAERISRKLRIPRSRLYAQALEAYIKEHGAEGITERLDKIYSKESPAPDTVVERLSLDVLRRERW